MDILSISPQEWALNEEDNLSRLLTEQVWRQIPLINVNEVHNFRDGSLVRFRGMIQDMYGPEYYLENFHVVNESTNEATIRIGKYCDAMISSSGEKIDVDYEHNVLKERQSYVVISIPGLNSWVQHLENESFGISNIPASQPSLNSKKRSIEEAIEIDGHNSLSKRQSQSKKVSCKNQKDFPKHLLNHPLANEKSKKCHIKIYKNTDLLKLNDIYDFVGFLSIDSVLEHIFDEDNSLESEMELQIHHPPSSLIPRIHVVHFKSLQHINPLLDDSSVMDMKNMAKIKKELLIVFTQLLLGDKLCAEYLVYNLISEIYLRRDFMPLGKFSINISHVPQNENVDYVYELYNFLERLLPKSHYLPLTLENINTLTFAPKKDYECNRLTSGILQLSKNTHLVLDETKLKEGKLDTAGIQGVKVLANAIRNQKVSYDFSYYPIEYDCDIPFIIFSEGKSMFPSDIQIPLKPDICVNTFREILDAAEYFLKPDLLNEIRKYLTLVKLIQYEISDQIQNLVSEEFVHMRQNSNATADDLHCLLVLSRLVCISEGKNVLDAACWKKAREMEQERKGRLFNK